MKKTAQEGVWEFVLDVDLQEGKPYSRKNLSRPGDKYNAARFPQMLKGYFEPTADLKLERDEWGLSLSGYAPIRDSAGNAVAVLGMDIMAADVYAMQQEVHRRATFVLLLSGFICVLIGFVIARMITNPVGRLIEGTRHISGGELGYQIEVKGKDEISELAKSFNLMAQSLQDSRRKLLDYFYQVVRSLVLVLEAKDHYTRGHSERVADYAGKTALKMGLPQDKAEMLKEAAMLHDVGKMGVPEEVLNKKEKLSEQEWEVIRKHPLLGEEILKPVLLNPELLEMVRGHHERYDGTGYPDKLRAGDINIYAAIVSVADAYDAMTSERAYRKAMSRAEAIEELKRNSASQFNPKVVQAFLRVLDEEKKY
jgi:putative nucleotidyltransferase with HDIG domain